MLYVITCNIQHSVAMHTIYNIILSAIQSKSLRGELCCGGDMTKIEIWLNWR